MIELIAAFSIGLFGSAHCVGMCGPIAFALPLNRQNNITKIVGVGSYSLGRLFTYFLLGCLFGIFGKGIAISGFQQLLTIGVGVSLILGLVIPYFFKRNIGFTPELTILVGKVKQSMGKRFKKQSNSNLLIIGLLNGLLPCGLVYMGLAGATTMVGPIVGGLFMLFFGLGTLPLMTSVSLLSSTISAERRAKIKKFIPVLVAIMGIVFILRGMNLGIPYLSPQISSENAEIVNCN